MSFLMQFFEIHFSSLIRMIKDIELRKDKNIPIYSWQCNFATSSNSFQYEEINVKIVIDECRFNIS